MVFFHRSKPKINFKPSKKDGFSGWTKCKKCDELLHDQELAKNLYCCAKCDHHYPISASDRIAQLIDPDTFSELFQDILPVDHLKFVDTESYKTRLANAQKKTGLSDAVVCGVGLIKQQKIALGVMDFHFMGGSMGSVVGERLTLLIEHAIEEELPVVIVSASGGARMQESIFSLMQMAKISGALARLSAKRLPFISILTHPTSGGVTASFASLGDVIIAEPKALICFAGPRVIEQTLKAKLPEDAQKSEFLLKHGMIDHIVKRANLRDCLALLVNYLSPEKQMGKQISRAKKPADLLASLSELMTQSKR